MGDANLSYGQRIAREFADRQRNPLSAWEHSVTRALDRLESLLFDQHVDKNAKEETLFVILRACADMDEQRGYVQ